jgi:hypothetical protein
VVKPVAGSLVFAVLVLVSGCRPSAPSESGWRDSAEQAVTDMVSEVATSRLTMQQELRDRFVGRYGVVVLTYAEEAAGKAADSVGGLQPPPAAQPSYVELTGVLSDATDAIAQARIALAAGDARQSRGAIQELGEVLAKLHRLETRLQAPR